MEGSGVQLWGFLGKQVCRHRDRKAYQVHTPGPALRVCTREEPAWSVLFSSDASL